MVYTTHQVVILGTLYDNHWVYHNSVVNRWLSPTQKKREDSLQWKVHPSNGLQKIGIHLWSKGWPLSNFHQHGKWCCLNFATPFHPMVYHSNSHVPHKKTTINSGPIQKNQQTHVPRTIPLSSSSPSTPADLQPTPQLRKSLWSV